MIKNGGGGDKFIDSDLDAGLKEKGIKTVIVTGTSAQGAVAGTSNGAASAATRRSCRSTACRRKIPTTSNTRPGTSPRADRW